MRAAAKEKEPLQETRKHKVFVIATSLTIFILSVITVCSYRTNIRFRKDFNSMLERKEAEFKEQLSKQRKIARNDLEEKYRADNVSYNAMIRRFEEEKN